MLQRLIPKGYCAGLNPIGWLINNLMPELCFTQNQI
jgi:hypothetical protein